MKHKNLKDGKMDKVSYIADAHSYKNLHKN